MNYAALIRLQMLGPGALNEGAEQRGRDSNSLRSDTTCFSSTDE